MDSLNELDEKIRSQALEKFKIIRPFLESEATLTNISTENSIPLRTLERWVERYRNNGFIGLARKDRKKGHRVSKEMQMIIEGFALKVPPLSAATIHRNVKDIARSKGQKAPSYQTVRRIIAGLDPSLIALAREGKKEYKNNL